MGFHNAIQIFFIVCALIFNVMFLNVYIGLLSSVYSDMYDKKEQIFAEFRSNICIKELVWQRFLSERLRLPCCGAPARVKPSDTENTAKYLAFPVEHKGLSQFQRASFSDVAAD